MNFGATDVYCCNEWHQSWILIVHYVGVACVHAEVSI